MSENQKIMDRIQKMLDRAAHPNTPEAERDQCIKRADALMHEHKISQLMLAGRAEAVQGERGRKLKPESRTVEWLSHHDEFFDPMMTVMGRLCELAGVRVVFSPGQGTATMVGYPEDIDYVHMLWMSSYLTFSSKLYPSWNPEETQGMNIRLHAEAGYKWVEIWSKAREADAPLTHEKTGAAIKCPPEDNGWMKRAMAKAYAETGEEKPKLTHGRRTYRESFMYGFQHTISRRVSEMQAVRRSRERETTGAELVLRSAENAVADLFNELYPPGSVGTARSKRLDASHGRASAAGAAAGQSVDMAGGARVGRAPAKQIG